MESSTESGIGSRACRTAALVGLLVVTGGVAAVPTAERQALVDLYHHTNGNDWSRNDGWLDPEGTECGWYGVHCEAFDGDGEVVVGLELKRNGLTGTLPESLGQLDHVELVDLSFNRLWGNLPAGLLGGDSMVELNLSENRLSGELSGLEGASPLEILDLGGNRMTGNIPESWSGMSSLRHLDLSRNDLGGALPQVLIDLGNLVKLELADNRFSGPVPDFFADLSLHELDLRGNLLTGEVENAFDAARWQVLVGDNDLTGVLSADAIDGLYETYWTELGGGLDICFTDIAVPDGMMQLVNEHHLGGSIEGCQDREVVDIDPAASGSWKGVDRSGEGLSQMLLEDGRMLVYWFGFAQIGDGQAFQSGVARPRGSRVALMPMHETADGRFSVGFDPGSLAYKGILRFNRTGSRSAHMLQQYARNLCSCIGGMCSCTKYTSGDFRTDMIQITRLAGSTCANQQPHQHYSGLWHDSERAGEGFIVEVLEDGRGLVYWLTYTPEGPGQAWFSGVGQFDGNVLHIDEMIQPVGGRFGASFDPDDVERVPWGTLTVTFNEDDTARVSWDSVLDGYGSGSYPITRIARPMLADCTGE